MASSLLIHITFTVKPEDNDKLLEVLRGAFDKIKAEPKCLYLNILQSSLKPGRVRVVEIWDAPTSWIVEELAKREWYGQFMEAVEKLLIEPREVEILNAIDGLKYVKHTS